MKEGTDTESRHADADYHLCYSLCAPVSAFGGGGGIVTPVGSITTIFGAL